MADEVIGIKIQADTQQADSKLNQLASTIEKMSKQVDSLTKTFNTLGKGSGITRMINQGVSAFNKLENKAQQTADKVKESVKIINQYERQGVADFNDLRGNKDWATVLGNINEKPSNKIAWSMRGIEDLQTYLRFSTKYYNQLSNEAKAYQKQFSEEGDPALKTNVINLQNHMSSLKAKTEEVTAAYAKLNGISLDSLKGQLESLRSRTGISLSDVNSYAKEMQLTNKRSFLGGDYTPKSYTMFESLGQEITKYQDKIASLQNIQLNGAGTEETQAEIEALRWKVRETIEEYARLNNVDLSQLQGALAQTGVLQENILPKTFGEQILSRLQNFTSLFGNMVRYRLMRLVISELIKKVQELYVKIRDLGKNIVADIKKTLTSIVKYTKSAFNTISGYFSTIFNAVDGLISTLTNDIIGRLKTNLIAAAQKLLEKFLSIITGKVISFKKVTRTLIASFDELNVLNKDNEDEFGFVKKISDLMDKWSDTIKKAWNSGGMFGDIGKSISEALVNGLNNIDWTSVKSVAEKVANTVITLINGMIEGMASSWSTLGNSIAEGVNVVFETLSRMVNEINWGELFAGMWTAISTAANNASWSDIFNVLGAPIELALKAIEELFNTWREGTLSNIISGLGTWLKEKIIPQLNKTLDAIYEWLTTVDAGKFMQSIVDWFNSIDWTSLMDKIVEIINKLVDVTLEALTQVDIGAIADKIIATLDKLDWNDIIKLYNIKETISNKIDEITNHVEDKVAQKKISNWWETSVAGQILAGIGRGLSNNSANQNVFNAINNTMDGIEKTAKDKAEIKSPSKVFERIGMYLIEGLIEGINSLSISLNDTITNMVNSMTNVFGSLKTSIINVFTSISSGIQSPISTIKSTVESLVSKVSEAVSNIWNKLKNVGSSISGRLSFSVSGLSLPSFDVGTNYVPRDMVAMVHKGEAIVPKAYNPAANNNEDLIETYIQVGRQIITAIENQSMQVSIGDDVIAKSAARGNKDYYRMTGKELISV